VVEKVATMKSIGSINAEELGFKSQRRIKTPYVGTLPKATNATERIEEGILMLWRGN